MNVLMGVFDKTIPPKTTKAGITYFAYGLDEYGPKRINKKAVNRMVAAGVATYLIEQFREWALRLPAELPARIDAAWQGRLDDWFKCVGRELPNGATITETGLHLAIAKPPRIIFHPEPFAVPQGKTAGAAYPDRIEVVIAYLDQQNTWLRKCDDLIAWEFGNFLGLQFGFRPQTVADEVGNRPPCS